MYTVGLKSPSLNLDCPWVHAQGADGMKILYRPLAKHRCGMISVKRLTDELSREAVAVWYVHNPVLHQWEPFFATAKNIAKLGGPAFSQLLCSLPEEKRAEQITHWFEEKSVQFLKLLPGAAAAFGENSLGWKNSLFETIAAISELEKHLWLADYIRSKEIPGMPLSLLLINMEVSNCVLLVKRDFAFTDYKHIKTGVHYPTGTSVVRLQKNPAAKPHFWAAELAAQTLIKRKAESLFQSEKRLKRLLVPLSVSDREIILPYISMSLLEYINELRKQSIILTQHQKSALQLALAEAVCELHQSVGLTHRDLKFDNIMLSVNSDGGFDLFIIDFGLSGSLKPLEQERLCGTQGWYPPEAITFILNKEEGDKMDIDPVQWDAWGLYMLLQSIDEMDTPHLGKIQKQDPGKFLQELKAMHTRPAPPPHTFEWVKHCLAKETPEERMSPVDACAHLKRILNTRPPDRIARLTEPASSPATLVRRAPSQDCAIL